MNYIEVPAKVISVVVQSSSQGENWGFDDGAGDPYWAGGTNPKPYRWTLELTVTPQTHSSHRTRVAGIYNGQDITVGDYISDTLTGVTLKIISISHKTDTSLVCEVEDMMRYNTYRDPSGRGNGGILAPANAIVYTTNEQGYPVLDPLPESGASSVFYSNLMSRFQNFEPDQHFTLNKPDHGFEEGEIISVDQGTRTFVRTTSLYPYVIGTVIRVNSPNSFVIKPIQGINEAYDYLIGDIGSVLYSSDVAGQLALEGDHPVMVKIRNNTISSVFARQEYDGNAGEFTLNNRRYNIADGSTIDDIISVINADTNIHGVTASRRSARLVIDANSALTAYGEPALDLSFGPVSMEINGHIVDITSTYHGETSYSMPYALSQDIAQDINNAEVPNIVAEAPSFNVLRIINTSGGEIVINDIGLDANGHGFIACTGFPPSTPATLSATLSLEAVDARAIDLVDISGDICLNMQIYSVENGIKAASLFIEQGIRKASTYVVETIAARDAINAMFGDQAFVANKGNGEWGHYILSFDNVWVKIADKDSSETDSQTINVEIDFESTTGDIHVVSGGSRVTMVTVVVTEAFDGENPTLVIGDADSDNRLMPDGLNDLTATGNYSTSPTHVYEDGDDVVVTYTLNANGSTTGRANIAISYT